MSYYFLFAIFSFLVLGGVMATATYVLYRSDAASVSAISNKNGNLTKTISCSIDELAKACSQTLEDLGLTIDSTNVSTYNVLLNAHGAEDKHVSILLNSNNNNLSHISIKTGSSGDEDASAMILEKIEERILWTPPDQHDSNHILQRTV